MICLFVCLFVYLFVCLSVYRTIGSHLSAEFCMESKPFGSGSPHLRPFSARAASAPVVTVCFAPVGDEHAAENARLPFALLCP